MGQRANCANHRSLCRRITVRRPRHTRRDVSVTVIAGLIPRGRRFKRPLLRAGMGFGSPDWWLDTSMSTEPRVSPESSSRPFTRLAAAWWALVVGLVILIVLLIFVAQNTESVTVHFLGFHWNLPVGVGYLLAAVAGGTTTVLVGAARIIQLRRAAKKTLRPL